MPAAASSQYGTGGQGILRGRFGSSAFSGLGVGMNERFGGAGAFGIGDFHSAPTFTGTVPKRARF